MMNIPSGFQKMAQNMIAQRFGTKEQAINSFRQYAGDNVVLNNALNLFENGNYKELENVGMNVLNEKKINPINMLQNIFPK